VASPAGHASILEHLTNKFYGDPRVDIETGGGSGGVEVRPGRGGSSTPRTVSQRNTTTCDVAASRSADDNGQAGNSFSDVIQRGVKLRRTVTSDRSAPKLPKN